jgi:hypothetical protein
MVWVRLDDQFPIHRKVGALSDQAFRLHVEAICWCARHLTDGVVSRDDLPQVTRIAKSERYAAELVARGCWSETDSGWEIHEYLTYQQSRSKVLQTREVRTAAGKAGGVRSGQSRRAAANGGKPQARASPEANAKQTRSKTQAAGVEPPAPLLLTEQGSGGAPAERAARAPDNGHVRHCPYPATDPQTCSICLSERKGAT